LISSGPFTFHAGDVQELDLAFAWARDYTPGDTTRSIPKLNIVVDSIRGAFVNNRVPGGGTFSGIAGGSKNNQRMLKIYPNPAREFAMVVIPCQPGEMLNIMLISNSGKTVSVSTVNSGQPVRIDVSAVPEGFYVLKVSSRQGLWYGKLLVVK
jgi:hypothetical protein